ncbi:MAG TPA: hypothetical protein VJN18_35745 [Polyangiaceae bacterium]|nr:hypothetical protein [Polyangiaceae bacterium]
MSAYDKWSAWAVAKVDQARESGGALTAGLLGKTAQKKFEATEFELEQFLTRLRNEGKVAIANGRWFLR